PFSTGLSFFPPAAATGGTRASRVTRTAPMGMRIQPPQALEQPPPWFVGAGPSWPESGCVRTYATSVWARGPAGARRGRRPGRLLLQATQYDPSRAWGANGNSRMRRMNSVKVAWSDRSDILDGG